MERELLTRTLEVIPFNSVVTSFIQKELERKWDLVLNFLLCSLTGFRSTRARKFSHNKNLFRFEYCPGIHGTISWCNNNFIFKT